MSETSRCFHCGEPNPDGAPIYARFENLNQPVCCIGCKAVAEFIWNSGLDAFYQHRESVHPELGLKAEESEWSIYDSEDLMQKYVHDDGVASTATVNIGGMYCAACVWLLDNAMKQVAAVESVSVNPATRRAVVRWDGGKLPFSGLLSAIAMVGFKPSPTSAGLADSEHVTQDKKALRRLIVAAAAGMQAMMFAVALYAGEHYGIQGGIEQFLRYVSLVVCIPIVFYSARPFFASAIRGVRARTPGMDLPVAIAITAAFLASLRAVLLGSGDIYFDSVAMFVLFLSATRYLEMRARHRSEDHAQALAHLLPETVTRVREGQPEVVSIDSLRVGDVVLIRPGDVIPSDGVVLSGDLAVDESMLTGETVPVSRSSGMDVFAGGVNRNGNASVEITLTGASTSLAEIGRLLERARADKPPVSILADQVAGKFVIGMLLISTVTGIIWLKLDPSRAFEIVLATLVVTCPCALSLATPAAIAAATSRLAKQGFLLVRSRVLEVFARPVTLVFDKTGTLTSGRPTVVETRLIKAGESMSDDECLSIAAAIETASEHVLARAFVGFRQSGQSQAEDIETHQGLGASGLIDGVRYRIGSAAYVEDLVGALPADTGDDALTRVWLASENGLIARFSVGDELRADAAGAIRQLRNMGHSLVIASGDRQAVVQSVASALDIDDWHANLSPGKKVELVHRLQSEGNRVVMVGDGINDAPVLSAADASIAIDAGTALARASADAIAMGKRLQSVVDAAAMSSATGKVIRQNVSWAIIYNLVAVPLAAGGVLAPWMAAIGMSVSSLIVVLNALRLQGAISLQPEGLLPPQSSEVTDEVIT